jgi:hypothetical protein
MLGSVPAIGVDQIAAASGEHIRIECSDQAQEIRDTVQ